MTEPATAYATGLTIATPGDWLVVDLDTLVEERDAAELIGPRLEELPGLAGHREAIAKTVAQSAKTGREQGVMFAAVLADVRDKDTLVMANLALGITDVPPTEENGAGAGTPTDEDALATVEGGAAAQEPDVEERAIDRVELTAGPALRIARIHSLTLVDGGPQMAVLTVQYWLAAPGSKKLAVLSFSTPSLGIHQELARGFHEIAMTLRFSAEPDSVQDTVES